MIRLFPCALAAVYVTYLLPLVLGSGTYIADLYMIFLLLCIDIYFGRCMDLGTGNHLSDIVKDVF